MIHILIVEDTANIRKLYRTYLEKMGYQVHEAIDGQAALMILETTHIDLMIADVMMPRMDGFTLVEELRSSGYDFPILMITAKDRLDDKRKGFSLGSDDYMVKPIDIDEMVLRVDALLRRSKISKEHEIRLGDLVIDEKTYCLSGLDQSVHLPKKEFQLLYKLLSYPNRIFTRLELMEEIWGYDIESDERTVDVHIKRIREKCIDIQEFEVITVRGIGYKGTIHV